jgi:uncharacterized membrane protein YdfJ with MMPL/SSD domain
LRISVFAGNAASMIGLGVSIGYSLFIISGYRDQRHQEERARAARPGAPLNMTAAREERRPSAAEFGREYRARKARAGRFLPS